MSDEADALRVQGQRMADAAVETARIKVDADTILEEQVTWAHFANCAMDFLSRAPRTGADALDLAEARRLAIEHAGLMITARRNAFAIDR